MVDAEVNYKDLFDVMRDACVHVNMNGNLLLFNNAYCDMLGYEREELLPKTYIDLTPEKWHAFEADIIQNQVVTRGVPEVYVKEYQRKDGTIFPVELLTTLIRDKNGNPSGMWATVRDISDRMQIHQELCRTREEYRALVENLPDILVRFDRNFTYIYANSAAADTVNLTIEQLIGRTLYQIGIPEECANICNQRLATVFETGKSSITEGTLPTPDGVQHFEYQEVPEYSQNGTISSVLVIGRNITERKRAEEALQLAHEELEQKVAERTLSLEAALNEQESFSYSVSHDLRAPLRHINSYLAMLSEEFGDLLPPEAHGFLDRSRVASSRMGNLIDDLLELSRVSRTNLVKETIDLSKVATHACDWLYETEPHRTVEVVINDGLAARGDKSLFIQMMGNLLGNAWKYTSTNPAARIEFGMEVISDQDIFYVRDNGVGFDMAYSDKLFGEFQRLHGAEYEGNGIGLATVKRIIDRHGGKVWADSKVNDGTTFYFSL